MTAQLLLALVPIALLIGLGAWLKHSAFLADSFWAQAERLGYYLLLPALFLHSLATAKLEDVPVQGMIGALVLLPALAHFLLKPMVAVPSLNIPGQRPAHPSEDEPYERAALVAADATPAR